MHDAELMDVYVDTSGKLWRVIGRHGEPTVILEEIESASPASPVQKQGGVSGLMWNGFKRIFRCEHDWAGAKDPTGGLRGTCRKCGLSKIV